MKIRRVLNSPEHFPSLTWAGGLTFELCYSNNTKDRDVISRPLQGLYFALSLLLFLMLNGNPELPYLAFLEYLSILCICSHAYSWQNYTDDYMD